jgi:hypothetical protein
MGLRLKKCVLVRVNVNKVLFFKQVYEELDICEGWKCIMT